MKSKYTEQILDSLRQLNELVFFLIDCNGNITDISHQATQMLAKSKEEIIGHINFNEIIKDQNFENILNIIKNKEEPSTQIKIKIKSRVIDACANFNEFKIDGQTLYLVYLPYLNERGCYRSHNKKLYYCIHVISNILNSTLEMDETLELILDKLKIIIEYDLACIMFLDGYNLNVKASKSHDKEYKLPDNIIIGEEKELSELLKIKSLKVIHNDSNNNHLLKELNMNWAEEAIFIPLILQESFFGIMVMFNEKKQTFSVEDIEMAEIFASTCAYSIKNAELSNVFRMQLRILRENVIERTKALELIKIQNQKILEADRMKNEFIAHMSHELRTPLHAIIGFSEALKMKIFGPMAPKQEEYIDDIHASGIHLLGMINDMLDLSKIEAKKMNLLSKDFSIELATNEVINVVVALANKKNITIKEEFCHSEDTIYADHRKYQQILYNLLSNAIKFTYDNGTIIVSTQDGKINGKNALVLKVKDNGVGISAENLDKIFFKFHQINNALSKSQAGSGLGLTITKELIEMHRGSIMVESELEEGSTFTIVLPLKTPETF